MFYVKWANPIGLFSQILKIMRQFLFSIQIIHYFCRVIASCTNFFVRYTINKLFNISYVKAFICSNSSDTLYGTKSQLNMYSTWMSLIWAQNNSLDFRNITQHAIKSGGWSTRFKDIHVTVCVRYGAKSYFQQTKLFFVHVAAITKMNLQNWRRYSR